MKKHNSSTTTSFILQTASAFMILSCGEAAAIQEAHEIEDSEGPEKNLEK